MTTKTDQSCFPSGAAYRAAFLVTQPKPNRFLLENLDRKVSGRYGKESLTSAFKLKRSFKGFGFSSGNNLCRMFICASYSFPPTVRKTCQYVNWQCYIAPRCEQACKCVCNSTRVHSCMLQIQRWLKQLLNMNE